MEFKQIKVREDLFEAQAERRKRRALLREQDEKEYKERTGGSL